MLTVLVTGGLGFIGSHTCISLLKKGHKIIILDSLINSSISTLNKINQISKDFKSFHEESLIFKFGDLSNKDFIREIFIESKKNNNPIQAVLHFAGLKSVSESFTKTIDYWNTNVIGSINLVEVMRENGCKNIVFSSSATIFKPKLNELLNEDSEVGPINPYGNTKLVVEKFLNDVFQSDNKFWSVALLRYFNPVGAHSSGLLGENPKGLSNNLFPIILKVSTGESERLMIYGNDYPTYDGTCVRDFIHVMDLADAHSASLDFLITSKPQIVKFNIGTGKGTSLLEVIDTFKKVNHCEIPYIFVERRMGDAPFLVADNKLALKNLRWKPIRDLQDMCKDSWKYKQINFL